MAVTGSITEQNDPAPAAPLQTALSLSIHCEVYKYGRLIALLERPGGFLWLRVG